MMSLSSLRYNISTGEYNGWDSSVNSSIVRRRVDVFNDNTNNVNNRRVISDLDVYSQFDFNTTQARAVGYNKCPLCIIYWVFLC